MILYPLTFMWCLFIKFMMRSVMNVRGENIIFRYSEKGNYCVLPEYHKCVLPPLT